MATITPGVSDIATKASVPQTDLRDVVSDATVTNIVEADVATAATLITISSSAPSNPKSGQGWRDTSTTPFQTKFWDGSEWVSEGVTVGSTAPTSPGTGQEWYDTTLDIKRIYETRDGITGWHPVDSGLQLATNRSGSTVAANRVVIRSQAATSLREFSTTAVVKNQYVMGVTLESIDNEATGVIATVASGRVVGLYVNGSTHSSVAKGDGLVTYSVAGESRGCGPLVANPYTSLTVRQEGLQLGCFAEAIEATSSDEVIQVRLLGQVGSGLRVWQDDTSGSVSDLSATSYTEVDLSTILHDSDHSPISRAKLTGNYQIDGGTTDSAAEFRVSLDQTTVHADVRVEGAATSGGGGNDLHIPVVLDIATVDDSTGSAAAIGDKFSYTNVVTLGSTATLTDIVLREYVC